MEFRGRDVAILGLGREGLALARFLAQKGTEVTVSDLKSAEELAGPIAELKGLPVRYLLGGHPAELLEAEAIFVSPGVPLEIPILVEARRRGIPLESETRLFFSLCPAPIAAITGSSGKSTTTALVGEMLKASGFRTFVGGNIGSPLTPYLGEIGPEDQVVMELSSFQLEMLEVSPHIAAVLNITPNHLDRHPSMEAYIQAKSHILRYQRPQDWAILGRDDPNAYRLRQLCRGRLVTFGLEDGGEEGSFLCGKDIALRLGGQEEVICAQADIRLQGQHNLLNVLAAGAVARLAGASRPAIAAAIASFTGLPHRLELVRELRGVRYYDDSIATSPERTIAALQSFPEPIVLLAGGRDKHLPMEEMAQLIRERVRQLILFGEAAEKIERVVGGPPPELARVSGMEEAVHLAAQKARPGEVVLLAPACTSFDMYPDFAARGEHFKELVNGL